MSTLNVLIVEDEAIVAADLASRVRHLGHAVSAILARGEDAVEHALNTRPDLVLMDIQLAGSLDGIEAAAIIRQSLDIPIIFLTAHSDRATLERASTAESFGYVLKPYDEVELEAQIELAVTQRRG